MGFRLRSCIVVIRRLVHSARNENPTGSDGHVSEENVVPIMAACVESLGNLYFALINPFLSHSITLWGNKSRWFLLRTSNLQKQAVRIINKALHNSRTV